jgi:exonuclease SbcC
MSLRFEAIRIKNVGPFRDVAVDLTAIPGPLVAVCGDNGEGKSTFLELLAGALHRECPTRGTLADLATAWDAMVEVTAVNGARHTVRQLVDNISRKGESLVLDENGAPVLPSGKVAEFDKWAAKHLPTPQVLFSSSFAPQRKLGFLDLSPTERKKLLVSLLGLERYELMAQDARERAKAAQGSVDAFRARLAAMPAPNVDALEIEMAKARLEVGNRSGHTADARKALERARAAAGDEARAAELHEQRKAAEKRLNEAQRQVEDLERRIKNNQDLIADGDRIREAYARTCAIDNEWGAVRDDVSRAQAVYQEDGAELEKCKRACDAQERELTRLERQHEAITARLKDRHEVREAVGMLEGARATEATLAAEETVLRAEEERLADLIIRGKDKRIDGLRAALLDLSIVTERDTNEIAQVALDGLGRDDAAREAQEAAPADRERNRVLLAEKQASLRSHRLYVRKLETLAARAADIDTAETELLDVEAQHRQAEEQARHLANVRLLAVKRLDESRAKATAAHAKKQDLEAERDRLSGCIAKHTHLQQAEAKIAAYTESLAPLRAQVEAAERELAALPVVDFKGPTNFGALEENVAAMERSEARAREASTRAQDAHDRALLTLRDRAGLEDEIKAAESEVSDWTRIAQDLGRDGLIALELDAALPEINTLANSLLHACHGPRFTVELRSTRTDASGKRELEACDFKVIDTEKGRDADADTYSGGECVIVGEAVALALTMLNCNRNGMEGCTIVRDESGSALDPQNGRAYIAMLRMAAKLTKADRVLYVSHVPELVELADARIVVKGGRVEVVS